ARSFAVSTAHEWERNAAATRPDGVRLSFAVLGDTHFVAPGPPGEPAGVGGTRGGRRLSQTLAFYAEVTRSVWPRIAQEVRAAAPDFVIQAGDVVEGGHSDATGTAADLRHALERLTEVGCPVLIAQGNHDRSPSRLAIPAWR